MDTNLQIVEVLTDGQTPVWIKELIVLLLKQDTIQAAEVLSELSALFKQRALELGDQKPEGTTK